MFLKSSILKFLSSKPHTFPFSNAHSFQVTQPHVNQRFDTFIKQNFQLSYSLIQKLLRTKKIHITTSTGKISDSSYRLQLLDMIIYPKTLKPLTISEEKPQEKLVYNEEKADIIKGMTIYEDKNYLILNKSSNISSQGGIDLSTNLLTLLSNFHEFDSNFSIIHRLDKNTTGVLILAKSKISAKTMSQFFYEQENIEKYYLALVEGVPALYEKKGLDKGMINLPIVLQNNKMRVCNLNNEDREECVSLFQILAVFDVPDKNLNKKEKNKVTLLKIKIKGGKKHQIRVHLSEVLKTPVLFDRKYGISGSKIQKNLKDLWKNVEFNHKDSIKNMIKFNGNEIFNENLKEKMCVSEEEIKNFEIGEYFALHALQVFIRTDEGVRGFDDLIRVGKGNLKGEIEIRAELPVVFKGLLGHFYGEKVEELCKNIEKIRF